MSRVQFKFGYTQGREIGTQAKASIKAGIAAFNLPEHDLRRLWENDGSIICTGDQFAVFLIMRYQLGGQNQFSALEPKLLDPVPPVTNVIDVTRGQR